MAGFGLPNEDLIGDDYDQTNNCGDRSDRKDGQRRF